MPPPPAPPIASPDRPITQPQSGAGQRGGATEPVYEYDTYYEEGALTEGAGVRPSVVRPAPPPPPPGRLPETGQTPSGRGNGGGGPGVRPREPIPDEGFHGQSQGRAGQRRYSLPPRGPIGPRNLGALREVLNYDPDREDRGGITIDDFLESAIGAATLGNLEESDLMQVMPMRLQGAAKAFYRSYMDNKGITPQSPSVGAWWDDFKEALEARFKKPTDSVVTLMKLANCRQGEKENVRAYAQRVKAMAIKLWPSLLQSQDPSSQEVADTLVYQHFQKGLRPHLLEYLNLKDIKTLDLAVTELSRKETFDQTQKERFGGQVNMVSGAASVSDETVTKLQEQMSDLKTTVSAYMAETTEMIRGQMASVGTALPEPHPEYWPDHFDCDMYQGDPALGFDEPDPPIPAESDGYDMVNAVEYRPRLPQYPMLRQPMPAGQGQYGPRGGCNYCGGPHQWRQCPRLFYRQAYPEAGVPYQGRFPRPIGYMARYPARPPRPTGAYPPRAMWRAPVPEERVQPNPWRGARRSSSNDKPALN